MNTKSGNSRGPPRRKTRHLKIWLHPLCKHPFTSCVATSLNARQQQHLLLAWFLKIVNHNCQFQATKECKNEKSMTKLCQSPLAPVYVNPTRKCWKHKKKDAIIPTCSKSPMLGQCASTLVPPPLIWLMQIDSNTWLTGRLVAASYNSSLCWVPTFLNHTIPRTHHMFGLRSRLDSNEDMLRVRQNFNQPIESSNVLSNVSSGQFFSGYLRRRPSREQRPPIRAD
jgi:hypothetical protein